MCFKSKPGWLTIECYVRNVALKCHPLNLEERCRDLSQGTLMSSEHLSALSAPLFSSSFVSAPIAVVVSTVSVSDVCSPCMCRKGRGFMASFSVARWQNLIPSYARVKGGGAQSKERKGSNFAAHRSGAIVQKPEGPNTNNDLKIWLSPSGNHAYARLAARWLS